ncbi:3-isopropylmalate dehydrogenase [Williamsia limnetica]|uniref:3-isopropylmalate dehydrogenase n=1 Tax=Williamsia limnetica TaxID=882452 RepID=A0A318RSI8_WILLI|nr:3-isopropylmalate dehydrogenase [Williamsia limnetica]PYE18654.1 3-isopropylmalate dehydrogenase [Williamsia limnetica]
MRTHNLAVIGGDGIGPEVTACALTAMKVAADRFGFELRTTDFDLGSEAYLRTGEALPAVVAEQLRAFDAIVLGAVGDPRVDPGVLERGLIVALRTLFHQSVNIRPVRLYPGVVSPVTAVTADNCDLVILRENTEGIYTGGGVMVKDGTPDAIAIQHSITTVPATSEIVEFGFRMASARRKRLTLCHKKNVLLYTGRLWQEIVDQIAERYPDVEHDYVHADAMCQHLILDPGRFDVVVTPNLFGDIISDLGAVVQGGLGVAASANFNVFGSAPSMYEPVHGSAPDIAGTGRANPTAAVLSAALCLAGLGEREAALTLEAAAASVLAEGGDKAGQQVDTAEVSARIAARVAEIDVPTATGSLMQTLASLAPQPV